MVVCPLRCSQHLILTAGPSQAGCRRHDPERRIGRKRRHPDAHASPESRQVARCATTRCASLQGTRGHGSIRDLTRRSGLFPAPDHSARPGRERLEEGTPSDAVDRERIYRDPKAPQDELHAHTTSRLPKFCASGWTGSALCAASRYLRPARVTHPSSLLRNRRHGRHLEVRPRIPYPGAFGRPTTIPGVPPVPTPTKWSRVPLPRPIHVLEPEPFGAVALAQRESAREDWPSPAVFFFDLYARFCAVRRQRAEQ